MALQRDQECAWPECGNSRSVGQLLCRKLIGCPSARRAFSITFMYR
jgi:hypothetical protein